MSYTAKDIRNVCLLGHSGTGKTSLVESMLYMTGVTDRLGSVAAGNTVCDYDPEETRRKVSVSMSCVPIAYRDCKLNIMDTPGYFDFSGEVVEALRVADAAIIVCNSKDSIAVGTEKAWRSVRERNMPCAFYISKTDEENGDYDKKWKLLRDTYGVSVCPVELPLWDASKKVIGVIDVVHKKTYTIEGKKRTEMPIPADKVDVVEELFSQLCESVAETSEELMNKFFDGEPFTEEEIARGLHDGIRDLTLCPVFCGSAINGYGTLSLLDMIVEMFPNTIDIPNRKGTNANGDHIEVALTDEGLPYCFVFKTISDQYGKYSFFKVISGKVTADMTLTNPRTGEAVKLGHLYNMIGKKTVEVTEVCCGDIAACSKLTGVKTGDTLCDARDMVFLTGIPFPAPCYSMSITPKVKGGEEKIAAGLARLQEEDQTFTLINNKETKQMVLSGTGDMQLDVLLSRLKTRFGVEAVLEPVKVAYRETIRKKIKVQGKHKKQSGGHGQYGDVWIEFSPCDSDDLVFEENVFGGSVPKNFFPAVEKGLRESVQQGVLAGYPVVGLKAVLVDGSYHPVDSSELAFKTAASLAYKAALPQAGPVLLEPIGELKVIVPENFTGDIMGDMNKRRGRVMGMNRVEHDEQEIVAEVPMAEVGSYAIDLRSMTQGRGSFTLQFLRYEQAPKDVQDRVVAAAKEN